MRVNFINKSVKNLWNSGLSASNSNNKNSLKSDFFRVNNSLKSALPLFPVLNSNQSSTTTFLNKYYPISRSGQNFPTYPTWLIFDSLSNTWVAFVLRLFKLVLSLILVFAFFLNLFMWLSIKFFAVTFVTTAGYNTLYLFVSAVNGFLLLLVYYFFLLPSFFFSALLSSVSVPNKTTIFVLFFLILSLISLLVLIVGRQLTALTPTVSAFLLTSSVHLALISIFIFIVSSIVTHFDILVRNEQDNDRPNPTVTSGLQFLSNSLNRWQEHQWLYFLNTFRNSLLWQAPQSRYTTSLHSHLYSFGSQVYNNLTGLFFFKNVYQLLFSINFFNFFTNKPIFNYTNDSFFKKNFLKKDSLLVKLGTATTSNNTSYGLDEGSVYTFVKLAKFSTAARVPYTELCNAAALKSASATFLHNSFFNNKIYKRPSVTGSVQSPVAYYVRQDDVKPCEFSNAVKMPSIEPSLTWSPRFRN